MDGVYPVVDSHCHFLSRSLTDARILAEHGIIPINQAMYPIEPSGAGTLVDMFKVILEGYVGENIKDTGLTAYTGLGVHPRCSHFPEEEHSILFGKLPDFLQRDFVVCVGEIGLDALDDTERMVLRRQLEVARDLRKPAVVHTPRENKAKGLSQTLDILHEVGIPPNLVILDHISEDVVDDALAFGGKVGLTVKKGKLMPEAVIRILQSHQGDVDRFVINSDYGYSETRWEDLVTVRTSADFIAEEMGLEVAAKVCRDNAAQFFGIKVTQASQELKPRRRLKA